MPDSLNIQAIPADLKKLEQWVLWKWTERDGKPTKPPYQVNGHLAQSTNPATWSTFRRVLNVCQKGGFDGIGFVLTAETGLVAFDLDHCIEATGELHDWALNLVEELDSYTEVTPSGEGLRVLVWGTLPGTRRRAGHFEVYCDGRYVTVTGNHLAGTPASINQRDEQVKEIVARVFDKQPDSSLEKRPVLGLQQPDDAVILQKALNAANGQNFSLLWQGKTDGYNSHSEADLALCSHLAFWTGNNPQRIDQLFRQSSLYREKWERTDYREHTIGLAIQHTETYQSRPQSANGHSTSASEPPAVQEAKEVGYEYITFPRTDAGNAELFNHLFHNNVRYDHRRHTWLVWQGHWWKDDANAEVVRLAKLAARKRYELAINIESLQERQAEAKWAIQSENRGRIDAALGLAQAELPLATTGEAWDTHDFLLAVGNGVVDLRTGEWSEGQRDQLLSIHTTVPYVAGAEAHRWQQFLIEVFDADPDLIAFIQKAIGYSATGDTSDQSWFLCYGSGSNGKSIFLRTIAYVLGRYGTNVPFSTFEKYDKASIPNDLASLVNKRYVTSSETNEGTRLNEARVKALTGGDVVSARMLYGEFFEFIPRLKLWLATNHRPTVKDDSLGFWRRVRLIPFLQRFTGEREDKLLEPKLKAEASGILNWIIEGALRYQAEGLQPPTTVELATNDYRADSDMLAGFLSERCVTTPGVKVRASELYKSYKEWANDEGLQSKEIMSNTAFGRRMSERFSRHHTMYGWVYEGVGIKTAMELS